MVRRPLALPMNEPILAPSLLASDHAALGTSAAAVAKLGLRWLHLDMMDGHFVPNLSFGPETLAALRRDGCRLFFDTHLMLSEPHKFVDAFAKAGANRITIHVEPSYDHVAALKAIRAHGCVAGIALNPGTAAEAVEPFLKYVDLVLVMTVQPGFGGQAFREDVLPKIAQVDRWRTERSLDLRIEVDGGIEVSNAGLCRAKGADTFVAGTSFFAAKDRAGFAAAFAAL
jgi:ribulose-phosphate 3-epimerase